MRKVVLLLLATCGTLLAAPAAVPFRVHYNIKGSGKDITVLAQSSAEARRTVMDLFPGAVVTGVSRIK
jgi:hypothetical protein